MTVSEFCDKYRDRCGKDCSKRIPEWYAAGYLGNATKAGKYNIPEDVPLPFYANKKVSTFPTLTRDILTAASLGCSIFPGMYPKIREDSFERVLQDCVDSQYVRVCYTESGYPFLELTTNGTRFLDNYTETERKALLIKAFSMAAQGISFVAALKSLGII